MDGADVYVGVSGGSVPEEIVASMAPDAIIFGLLRHTGMRRGELLSLRIEQLDLGHEPRVWIRRNHDDVNDSRRYQPVAGQARYLATSTACQAAARPSAIALARQQRIAANLLFCSSPLAYHRLGFGLSQRHLAQHVVHTSSAGVCHEFTACHPLPALQRPQQCTC